jgi:hypothetical protein
MKRVLLPIEGSECALRGVALVIAKSALYLNPKDLDIHLVNLQAPFSHDVSRFASHGQIVDFHRDESEKAMHGACQPLDAAGAAYSLPPQGRQRRRSHHRAVRRAALRRDRHGYARARRAQGAADGVDHAESPASVEDPGAAGGGANQNRS